MKAEVSVVKSQLIEYFKSQLQATARNQLVSCWKAFLACSMRVNCQSSWVHRVPAKAVYWMHCLDIGTMVITGSYDAIQWKSRNSDDENRNSYVRVETPIWDQRTFSIQRKFFGWSTTSGGTFPLNLYNFIQICTNIKLICTKKYKFVQIWGKITPTRCTLAKFSNADKYFCKFLVFTSHVVFSTQFYPNFCQKLLVHKTKQIFGGPLLSLLNTQTRRLEMRSNNRRHTFLRI